MLIRCGLVGPNSAVASALLLVATACSSPGSDSSNAQDQCYDGYGTVLDQLDERWRYYALPFAELSQRGWGYGDDHVDTVRIRNVEWTFGPGVAFEIWLDDVTFYR